MLSSTSPFATPSVMVRPRFSGKPIDHARSPCAGISLRQPEGRQFEVVGRDDGEVVAYVNGEDVQGPSAPVAGQEFEAVLSRVQHGLRHDVIVRHDPAPVVDGETAPMKCARFGLVEEAADLHDGVACRIEPDLRIVRELLARDLGIERGRVDRGFVRRLLVRSDSSGASPSGAGSTGVSAAGAAAGGFSCGAAMTVADPHSHSAATRRATFNRSSYRADKPVEAVYPGSATCRSLQRRRRSMPHCISWACWTSSAEFNSKPDAPMESPMKSRIALTAAVAARRKPPGAAGGGCPAGGNPSQGTAAARPQRPRARGDPGAR